MAAVLKGASAQKLKSVNAGVSTSVTRAKVMVGLKKGAKGLKSTATTESTTISRMQVLGNIQDKKKTKLCKSPAPVVKNISDRTKLMGAIKRKEVELEDTSSELERAEKNTEWATKAAYKKEKSEKKAE
eukprot:CAMPEP_0185256952 /NCGR_PEP_ID=MMETSP1359-20130426/6011_1 /TAXON_ID=552665 /ORGANISM="Bigelowiella longifila, Strain CCMP242" /LENGTH=128 /DNA_ID=CAMNT_0027841781 /DNA_START=155 /DNA_END=541 /DNA_ORIENTATION=+